MTDRSTSRISSRKLPGQARSTELVASILEAAVQVLATEGAQPFTTAPEATRQLAGELIITTMTAVAKAFSETPRTEAEIDTYADAMADMFCAYLGKLELPATAGPQALVDR